jgi:hypothetical protein
VYTDLHQQKGWSYMTQKKKKSVINTKSLPVSKKIKAVRTKIKTVQTSTH